jgi:hypothetical protein
MQRLYGLFRLIKKTTVRFLNILWVSFLALSCNKNNDSEKSLRQWQILKVEGSSNGSINQVAGITVYWPYTSGSCDFLSKFEESRQGSIITVKAMGYSTGGICTMDAGIKKKIYEFISASAGTFEIRFLNPDNSFIAHTVVIN